jgi:hypothetical protein
LGDEIVLLSREESDAVLVDEPLYCAAFNSCPSAIAEAAPPAGPHAEGDRRKLD